MEHNEPEIMNDEFLTVEESERKDNLTVLGLLGGLPKNSRSEQQKMEERNIWAQGELHKFHKGLSTEDFVKFEREGLRYAAQSVEYRIKDQLKDSGQTISENAELSEVAQRLGKFDWRSFGVVPFVHRQGGQFCWAYAAAAAYESSLMIQRANFAFVDPITGVAASPVQPHRLTINRRLLVRGVFEELAKKMKRKNDVGDPQSGNHELAFSFLVEKGCPIKLQKQRPESLGIKEEFIHYKAFKPEAKLGYKRAIAWDYVHNPGFNMPTPEELKTALLQHGPLTVTMEIDGTFRWYGDPDDKAHVFYRPPGGTLHMVLLIGWDDDKDAWIIQNSYGTDWGYSCWDYSYDGVQDNRADYVFNVFNNDRGYMYIRRNSSNIGMYAAWIEARLYTPRNLALMFSSRKELKKLAAGKK